jgi:hypothetical protein
MEVVEFRCAICDVPYRVTKARIPEKGVGLACRGCGAPIKLYPDGRVIGGRLQGEPDPFSAPVDPRLAAQIGVGPAAQAGAGTNRAPSPSLPDVAEVADLDLGSVEIAPAPEVPRQLAYIPPPAPPPDRAGTSPWTRGFPTRDGPRPPFHRDLPAIAASPVRGALGTFAGLVVLEVVGSVFLLLPLFAIPLIGSVLVAACQTVLLLDLVKGVATGADGSVSEWSDVANVSSLLGALGKVLLVVGVPMIPFVLLLRVLGVLDGLAGAGPATYAAVGAAGLCYLAWLPVCVAAVAIHDNWLIAVDPRAVVRIVLRLGPSYAIAVATWAVLVVTCLLAAGGLSRIPFAGGLLGDVVLDYGIVVAAVLLGRVFREGRAALGW